jgi:hypothetical protein
VSVPSELFIIVWKKYQAKNNAKTDEIGTRRKVKLID